jgi:hypothetical protein
MIALSPRLYADLIGKPFVAGARGPDAYDCLGLAILLQRRQGRPVPEYSSSLREFHRNYDEALGIFGPCRRVSKPEVGCVVLLRGMEPGSVHVGTLSTPYKLLHASESAGSVVNERLIGSRWEHRVLGYYVIGGAQ